MRAIESKLSVNICFIVFKTVILASFVRSSVTHLMTFSVERFIIHFILKLKYVLVLCPLIEEDK